MDRNVWDPATPPGAPVLQKNGRVVELCVYSFEHSAKDLGDVRADVAAAIPTWCQASINIQAIHWERLPRFAATEGPYDLNSPTLAGTVPCANPSQEGISQLFSIGMPHRENLDRSRFIAVYYIPGTLMLGGGKGCHLYRFSGDRPPEHIILMTDEANANILAHELGHALFTHSTGPGDWTNDDPDPSRRVGDPMHNSDPDNLMSPNVPNTSPKITPPQQALARESLLVSTQNLVYGTRRERFKLEVTLNSLKVDWTDDEAFSDDALESKWQLRVKTGTVNSMKPYENSRLGSGVHNLPNHTYPLLEMTSDSDKLEIHVTGEDWDFWSGNDPLPPIHKVWSKGADLWGAESTTAPGGTPGEHLDGPHENDEIKYSLSYKTTVVQRPGEDAFRTIC